MLQLLAALVAGAAIPMGASQMGRGASKQPKARRIDSTADSREIADLTASASSQLVFKWDVSSHALVVTTEDAKGNCVSHTGTLPQNTGPKLPKGAPKNLVRMGGGKIGMALRMGSAAAGVAGKRGKGGSQPGLIGVPVAEVDRLE